MLQMFNRRKIILHLTECCNWNIYNYLIKAAVTDFEYCAALQAKFPL